MKLYNIQIFLGCLLTVVLIIGGFRVVTYNNPPKTIEEYAKRDHDNRPFNCEELVHHTQTHLDDIRIFWGTTTSERMNALVYQQETGYTFKSCQAELNAAYKEACQITHDNDFYSLTRAIGVFDSSIKYTNRPKHLSSKIKCPKDNLEERLAKYRTPYKFEKEKSLPLYLPEFNTHVKPLAIKKNYVSNVPYIELLGSDNESYSLFIGSEEETEKLIDLLTY